MSGALGRIFHGEKTSVYSVYPLVNKQKTIENGPVEIVDLPIKSMVIFHRFL